MTEAITGVQGGFTAPAPARSDPAAKSVVFAPEVADDSSPPPQRPAPRTPSARAEAGRAALGAGEESESALAAGPTDAPPAEIANRPGWTWLGAVAPPVFPPVEGASGGGGPALADAGSGSGGGEEIATADPALRLPLDGKLPGKAAPPAPGDIAAANPALREPAEPDLARAAPALREPASQPPGKTPEPTLAADPALREPAKFEPILSGGPARRETASAPAPSATPTPATPPAPVEPPRAAPPVASLAAAAAAITATRASGPSAATPGPSAAGRAGAQPADSGENKPRMVAGGKARAEGSLGADAATDVRPAEAAGQSAARSAAGPTPAAAPNTGTQHAQSATIPPPAPLAPALDALPGDIAAGTMAAGLEAGDAVASDPLADTSLPDTRPDAVRREADAAARAGGSLRLDAAGLAALAGRFATKLAGGVTRFEVRLDPPELGKLDVRVEIDADGVTRAEITAERPEALAELSRHQRELQRALAEAGIQLDRERGLAFTLAEHAEGRDRRGDADAEASPGGAGRDRTAPEGSEARDAPAPGARIATPYGYALLVPTRLDVLV